MITDPEALYRKVADVVVRALDAELVAELTTLDRQLLAMLCGSQAVELAKPLTELRR